MRYLGDEDICHMYVEFRSAYNDAKIIKKSIDIFQSYDHKYCHLSYGSQFILARMQLLANKKIRRAIILMFYMNWKTARGKLLSDKL